MKVQLHRFLDKWTLSVTSKVGVRLTPDDMRALATALLGCAEDIEANPDFSASDFATFVIQEE